MGIGHRDSVDYDSVSNSHADPVPFTRKYAVIGCLRPSRVAWILSETHRNTWITQLCFAGMTVVFIQTV
jgi:hypothetical protein